MLKGFREATGKTQLWLQHYTLQKKRKKKIKKMSEVGRNKLPSLKASLTSFFAPLSWVTVITTETYKQFALKYENFVSTLQ